MSIPSINPSDIGSLKGGFRAILTKFIQGFDGAIPAVVRGYDRPSNRANVQPLIQLLDTDNRSYSRAQIPSVPVLQLGSGSWRISFPINSGDLGWLIACDRDISLFLQSYRESQPQTLRIKNFSDSFFIPDVMNTTGISGGDLQSLVVGSIDGTIKITLNETNGITITAPPGVIINTNAATVNTEQALINASTNVIATTPLFAVSGNITAGGTIMPGVPPP